MEVARSEKNGRERTWKGQWKRVGNREARGGGEVRLGILEGKWVG